MHLLAVIGLCLASAFLAVVVMCLLSINRDNRHRATVADLRAQIAALEGMVTHRDRMIEALGARLSARSYATDRLARVRDGLGPRHYWAKGRREHE